MGFLAEEILHHFAHARHAGHAAHQHHVVDVAGLQPGVGQSLLARLKRALDQVGNHLFKVGAGDRFHEVERRGRPAFHPRGNERQVDFRGLRARQLDLGLFGGFLQPLQRQLVGLEVKAFLGLELVGQPFDQLGVEILTAEEGVAVGALHLEHAVTDFEHRDVESAAAKVVDRNRLAVILVEAIGQRGRGRLVDDPQHLKPGDLPGILGGLTLGVVEVGGHRDHGLRDGLAQIALGGFLHLLKREGADLAGAVVGAAGGNPGVAILALGNGVGHQLHVLLGHRIVVTAADQALDRENGVITIGNRLALGRLADQPLTILGEGDDRRRGARPFRIFDDLGLAAVHHGHAAVGGAKVDTDDFTHEPFPRLLTDPARWRFPGWAERGGGSVERDIGTLLLGTRGGPN